MTPPSSQQDDSSGDGTLVNIVLLSFAVVALAAGLFVYVDRDGPGRTHDAIIAADLIEVSANVQGPIVELAARDNQVVAEGDLLFRIDARPYVARANAAQGAHDKARAVLADSEALFKRTAAEAAEGRIVSQQTLDNAQSQRDANQATAHETEANLALAKLNVEYCSVKAPFDGIVTNLQTQVGEYVNPGDPVFSLIDANSFHVVAYMKEQYLEPAVVGAKAKVSLWQYPDDAFEGVVASIGRGVHSRRSVDGLPVVEKTLDWVQLAARIPVRIDLETDRPLTLGATAHVRITR